MVLAHTLTYYIGFPSYFGKRPIYHGLTSPPRSGPRLYSHCLSYPMPAAPDALSMPELLPVQDSTPAPLLGALHQCVVTFLSHPGVYSNHTSFSD